MQLWRNWHTRMIQVHVSITLVRVQVPPTALQPLLKGRGCFHVDYIWKNFHGGIRYYGGLYEIYQTAGCHHGGIVCGRAFKPALTFAGSGECLRAGAHVSLSDERGDQAQAGGGCGGLPCEDHADSFCRPLRQPDDRGWRDCGSDRSDSDHLYCKHRPCDGGDRLGGPGDHEKERRQGGKP